MYTKPKKAAKNVSVVPTAARVANRALAPAVVNIVNKNKKSLA